MTGEISLLGDVLPVGGVREKLLAAYRMGVSEILLPRENARDLEKIDARIREKLRGAVKRGDGHRRIFGRELTVESVGRGMVGAALQLL